MTAPRKYPNKRRERAQLPGWCEQADIDAARRPETTTPDASGITELEWESPELKPANEILLDSASPPPSDAVASVGRRDRLRPGRHRGMARSVAVAAVLASTVSGSALFYAHQHELLRVPMNGPDRLITNEFAYRNADDPLAVRSPVWEVTSGSLFAHNGVGWTGRPDAGSPGPRSQQATNSAVFRARTIRHDFGDVQVDFRLRLLSLSSTSGTPAENWDGVHVLLRYQNPQTLYEGAVVRRDGLVAFKKKTAGGPSNGGTYTTLAVATPGPRTGAAPGVWQNVRVQVRDEPSGAVSLTMIVDGRTVLHTLDRGQAGPPLTAGGAVGLRGDNAEFEFADFRVSRL